MSDKFKRTKIGPREKPVYIEAIYGRLKRLAFFISFSLVVALLFSAWDVTRLPQKLKNNWWDWMTYSDWDPAALLCVVAAISVPLFLAVILQRPSGEISSPDDVSRSYLLEVSSILTLFSSATISWLCIPSRIAWRYSAIPYLIGMVGMAILFCVLAVCSDPSSARSKYENRSVLWEIENIRLAIDEIILSTRSSDKNGKVNFNGPKSDFPSRGVEGNWWRFPGVSIKNQKSGLDEKSYAKSNYIKPNNKQMGSMHNMRYQNIPPASLWLRCTAMAAAKIGVPLLLAVLARMSVRGFIKDKFNFFFYLPDKFAHAILGFFLMVIIWMVIFHINLYLYVDRRASRCARGAMSTAMNYVLSFSFVLFNLVITIVIFSQSKNNFLTATLVFMLCTPSAACWGMSRRGRVALMMELLTQRYLVKRAVSILKANDS